MCEAVKYSLFDDMNFLAHFQKKFRFMKAPLVDGVITWASSLAPYLSNEQIIEKFSALSPLPMVDIGYLDIPGVSSLRIDNSLSMELIFEHLVKVHGYKKIAFFGCEFSRPHTERLESFRQALGKFSLKADDCKIFTAHSLSESDIVRTTEEIIRQNFNQNEKSDKKIEAIITSSDIIASILIKELQKNGISVPEDVAVTGFNNQYQGITCEIPVTTIDLEYFRRGYMAVELLINQIMNPKLAPKITKIPTSLVVRESCGCFEGEILRCSTSGKSSLPNYLSPNASEEEGREFLFTRINQIFPKESHERKMSLVDAIFTDLYEKLEIPRTLQWFRKFLGGERGRHFNETDCQHKVTLLRFALLKLCPNDENQKAHIENILSQLRVLCSVTSDYERIAQRDSSYIFNNITQAAMDFASVSSGLEMQTSLRTHLSDLGIPGIILSLSYNMTSDLEESRVCLVLPDLPENEKEKLPYKVTSEELFPKAFFPKNTRYSLVLEILHYSDRYFGFAFLQMKTRNMALYDSVRVLLCHALYNLYIKEGRTQERAKILERKPIQGIFEKQSENLLSQGGKLTAQKLTAYLLEHISEKTDLDKMTKDFGMNKTKLIRQSKNLTGYTVQALHEKLKIEQAKTMLLEGHLTLSEIAERLGFQNGNYFSNVFKKNTGKSPRTWAKSNT